MNKLSKIAFATVTLIGMAAVAQPKTDPKAAGGAGAPKADMKTDMKTDMKDMKDMNMKPPQELADMAKVMNGTWKCTGKAAGMDGKTMADMTGTMKPKLEMDGCWMHDSFDAKMGKMPFHFESYTTVDSKKQWHRVMAESGGGMSVGSSDGPKDNKMDWTLDSQGPMGAGKFKDHVDWSDMKAGVKAWGEMSMDGGKTFNKVYEMTCKK